MGETTDATLTRLSSGATPWKLACRCVSTTQRALSGLPVIDGVQTATGDRVLVTGQNDASENGIYVAGTRWERAIDFSADIFVKLGCTVGVVAGTVHAASLWMMTSPSTGSVTIGVTDIAFTEFDTAGAALGLSDAVPEAIGIGSAGASVLVSRADHTHQFVFSETFTPILTIDRNAYQVAMADALGKLFIGIAPFGHAIATKRVFIPANTVADAADLLIASDLSGSAAVWDTFVATSETTLTVSCVNATAPGRFNAELVVGTRTTAAPTFAATIEVNLDQIILTWDVPVALPDLTAISLTGTTPEVESILSVNDAGTVWTIQLDGEVNADETIEVVIGASRTWCSLNGALVATGAYPVDITVFGPTSLAGLEMWLSGDALVTSGSNIEQATDLSGNARHFLKEADGTRPVTTTVSGLPVIRVNGATQTLVCNTDYNPTTCTVILILAGVSGNDGSLVECFGKGGSFGGGTATFGMDFHATSVWCEGYDGNRAELTHGAVLNATRVFALTCANVGGNIVKSFYEDGVPRGNPTTTSGGNGALDVTTGTNARLGRRINNAALQDYRHVLLYSRALTAYEMGQIETWAGSLGGQLLFDGNSMVDSITSNFATDSRALLQTAGRPALYRNVGVSGQTIAQMIADATADVDAYLISSKPWKVCVYWEGRNALAAGVPRATVLADLIAYGTARRAAGWKVLTICVPPSANVNEIDRQFVNNGLEAAVGVAWDSMFKESDDPTLFAAGANLNLTHYNVDQVHPIVNTSNVGYNRLAQEMVAFIQALT